ncbi:MAG: LysR family transcriptional regulator [Acidobacteria bacterium]|nr:LysR family transcriptional regulator [Acidobacteriota bacterium]
MDLPDLNVFLTVAREKSFSRAAEKLFRTQPAVSLAIRRLEDWLGQPLFARGARQTKLTDAGELLMEYAERMLNLREEIKKGIDDLTGRRRGELSLGVNESSIHALLPALARYRQLYPGVRIAIRRTYSREIPHEILNYRLDLGVVSFVPQEEKLKAVEIRRDELTFVVYPRHRLARRETVDITELGEETFVAHIVDTPYRWRVIQLFQKHRVPLLMHVEMPTIESIKRFVQMEMGVAIVPRMCVEWEVEQGTLAEVKIRQLHMPRHLYLIYREGARVSHAAQALLRLLRTGDPGKEERAGKSAGEG